MLAGGAPGSLLSPGRGPSPTQGCCAVQSKLTARSDVAGFYDTAEQQPTGDEVLTS